MTSLQKKKNILPCILTDDRWIFLIGYNLLPGLTEEEEISVVSKEPHEEKRQINGLLTSWS